MKFIDGLLNKITMYRLVLYELGFLLVVAGAFSYFGVLSFAPQHLLFSVAFIFSVCWMVNEFFAAAFDAPSNPESVWITAFILALIITPPSAWIDGHYLPLAIWASALAMASKYMFVIGKKHLFNPAAFGIAGTGAVLGLSASWWVGTPAMDAFVLAAGLLIVRKIHRFDLWTAFIATFFVGILYAALSGGSDVLGALGQSFFYAPVFFFGTVMLTEPMTTPPTRILRVIYGALVAIFLLPNFNVGGFYLTPELALLAGNIFAYLVSPKHKLILRLKEKVQLSRDVYEFVFTPEKPFSFAPGQYMEWTLAHENPDSRSIRRYFTIASSPTEATLRLGVKFYAPASSFKKALFSMHPGDAIVASQLSGDFTLPRDKKKGVVMLAGGIGITPFRSQLQYLLDTKERRPLTILYSNKTPDDAVYHELLSRAERELGAKVVYAFTDPGAASGFGVHAIDEATIAREVPDYEERTFYISGPQGMVTAFKDMLRGMGVARTKIRTDYFPGFA